MTCEVIDPCANDPSQCSVKALCQKATEKKKGEIDWNINAQAHVALAKEYGISCGVLTSTAKGDLREYNFTKNDFMKLSKKERKQLQFGL